MRRRAHRFILVSFVVLACDSASESTVPLSAGRLASAWSGGRADPVCSSRGPRGEYLGPIPGAEHCQWPTVARGSEFGTVTATRDSVNGWTSITWERVLSDTARVRLVLDSLDTELGQAGLVAYRCVGGGRRWQAPGLVVQSTPAIARLAGGVIVLFAVVPDAAAIPQLLCPDAPPAPPRSDSRARTS